MVRALQSNGMIGERFISMANELIKVRFELDSNDWHGHSTESLWASPIGASEGYQILNSPFFRRGIAFNDVVKAAATDQERVLDFEDVIGRSGHSTYMFFFESDTPTFRAYWQRLKDKGCSFESMDIKLSIGRRTLYSVDVPPSADLGEVYRLLEQGELAGLWRFQEGYGHWPNTS
jgi:hypothetical protein